MGAAKSCGSGGEIIRTYLVTIGLDNDGQEFERREPLPRCSECAHCVTEIYGTAAHPVQVPTCSLRKLQRHITEPNGFCAWGKRKEGE